MSSHSQSSHRPYILGLDIGVRSIGWAIIDLNQGSPTAIHRAGVRCFEAGVEGSIEQGKESSRATVRRVARLSRRQTWRRAQRAKNLFRLLQSAGLLPEGDFSKPESRHQLLLDLDNRLTQEHGFAVDSIKSHLLPYLLRAAAAEGKVERFELGRALYHLAQRRGYLSNRKSDKEEDEDERGQVKQGISDLQSKLNGLTLGQYFATLDPREERIRRRWTSRLMYLEEFDGIWKTQAPHHGLTDDQRKAIHKAIFFQRPLRSQKGLIGKCDLESSQRRAPQAAFLAQEFRLLQTVNHLRIRFPSGEERALEEGERKTLVDALQEKGDLTCAAARKLLSFTKKGTQFTTEEWGEKSLPGNRTHAKLASVFGKQWVRVTTCEKDQIVLEVLHYQKPAALIRRAMSAWKLDRAEAEKLSELRLEAGHSRHSIRALEKLVPLLRMGKAYSTARKEAYPASFSAGKAMALLPPVVKARPDLRNPAVCRALTELRKVVNEIVRLYGKPERIRVELARDLKRSRKDRKRVADFQREQELKRKAALQRILKEFNPNYELRAGFDPAIEKILLAEECNWQCPFTGKGIEMATLLGGSAQFDVAHIFPRRYLDDSFINKTLCYHDENRHRMHDLLPVQAYGSDVTRWQTILGRVQAFKGNAARVKFERFQIAEVPDDFVDSQLNDTRYNSIVAGEYLGLLYGGACDESGVRRVETITGGITHLLRNGWRLPKDRNVDHRHHAQDAIVLALTTPAQVGKLQKAAELASARGERLKAGELPEPWPGFREEVRERLDQIVVSFRCNRKLQGALHAATNYSRPIIRPGGKAVHHVRKQLHKLTITEVSGDSIVDPVIRKLVQEKFVELGGKDPKKAFAEPNNHPALKTKKGKCVPIHKVRLRVSDKPRRLGSQDSVRYVTSGANSNHHCVIVADLDNDGKEVKWTDLVVSRLDANSRLNKEVEATGKAVIQRQWGPRKRFKFSLIPNDFLRMADDNGVKNLYRVVSISQGDVELRHHSDARDSTMLKKDKARLRIRTADTLRLRRAYKVTVSPLGDWTRSHD